MKIFKRLAGAFVVGGCAGVVGQLFITFFSFVLTDAMLAVMLSMLCVGLIGAVLVLTDVYPKISRFGGFGAELPVCGLIYGASCLAAIALKAGATPGAAFKKGFSVVAAITFIGFTISAVIGFVLTLTA
jgi:hypothetical protein